MAQVRQSLLGNLEGVLAGEHEAPHCEAGHGQVVGPRLEASGFNSVVDAPEGLPRHQRRGALDAHGGIGRQPALQQLVEARGVELAQGVGVGIREVHQGDIKGPFGAVLGDPHHGIGVHDLHPGVEQGALIEVAHHRHLGGHGGHGGIQIHQHHPFHAGVLEDLPHRQTVTASADQDALGAGLQGEGRMHQGFVVAVFIGAGKLEVAVEEELEAAPAPGHHDALIVAVLGVDDFVRKDLFLHRQGEPVCPCQTEAQQGQDDGTPQADQAQGAHLGLEQEGRPQAHTCVEQPEEEAGAHQAELGHEQQGKEQGRGQGADVVEGQYLGYEILEFDLMA